MSTQTDQPVLAWHTLPADRCLRFGTREQVHLNVPISVEGSPILCVNGLHASRRAIDAMLWAAGPIVCRVEVAGEIVEDGSQLVGTRRTVLGWCDARQLLQDFAFELAGETSALAESRGVRVDPVTRKAIDVKRAWLAGKAADEELATVTTYASNAVVYSGRNRLGWCAIATAFYAANFLRPSYRGATDTSTFLDIWGVTSCAARGDALVSHENGTAARVLDRSWVNAIAEKSRRLETLLLAACNVA